METNLCKADNTLAEKSENRAVRRPRYNVVEADNGYRVEVYLPGVAKDGIHVAVENKQLWIRGQRAERPKPEGKYVYREIPTEDFALRLNLNADIRVDGIRAKAENGILSLVLPVAEEALPREIAVE